MSEDSKTEEKQEDEDEAVQAMLNMLDPNKNPSPDASDADSEAAQMRAILSNAVVPERKEKPKVAPGEVKFAAALLIVHGLCLAANSVLWRDPLQNGVLNPVDMLRGLLWLGFTIVLAGALLDCQAWAWWIGTLLGGIIGVGNLLATAGYFVGRSIGAIEGTSFIVPFIGVGAVALLIGVALLMLSSSKEAFGVKKAVY